MTCSACHPTHLSTSTLGSQLRVEWQEGQLNSSAQLQDYNGTLKRHTQAILPACKVSHAIAAMPAAAESTCCGEAGASPKLPSASRRW